MKTTSAKAAQRVLESELQGIRSLKRLIKKELANAVDVLDNTRGKIVVTGLGKSGYIGMKLASTLTSMGIPAVFLHPGEAMHGDLGIVARGDSIIALSFSGETKEILRLLSHIKRYRIPVISITGGKHSSLKRMSDVAIIFAIKEEGSPFNLAPMASTTASLVIGDMLAGALGRQRGFTKQAFATYHPGGSLGLQLTSVEEAMSGKKSLPLVSKNAPLPTIVRIMTKHRLGATGVMTEEGRLVGVITDGDIRRSLLQSNLSKKTRASELMTAHPKTIGREESLQAAIQKMEQYKVTALFVLNGKRKPIGMIHMHQIVESNLV